VKRYYEAHRDDFTVVERRRLLQIVVPSEKKANETLKKLGAGANFDALARTLSSDPTARSGAESSGGSPSRRRPRSSGRC